MIGKPEGGMATELEKVRESTTLRVLEEMARAWAREVREGEVLEVLGRELEQILPCDRAYLLKLDKRGQDLMVEGVYRGVPGGLEVGHVVSGSPHIVELVEGGVDVLVCSNTKLWSSEFERRLAQEGVGACISLRLSWQGAPVGILAVASERTCAYGPAQVRMLHQIAPALGAHIWKAEQHTKLEAPEATAEDERERILMAVVGGISHYFNGVLANLLGGLALLRDCQLDSEGHQLVGRMESRVVEGGQMVRALQQFAAEEPPAGLVEIELGELAEEVIELTRPVWEATIRATGRRIQVLHQSGEGLRVRGNRRDLREALINVLFNAIQAMPRGGSIWVTEGTEGIWNYLEVMDQGVGMKEEIIRRSREPFFTTQPGRRQGLGLSVTSGIMRRHGGEVGIVSEPGKGTTVRLNLLSTEQGEK